MIKIYNFYNRFKIIYKTLKIYSFQIMNAPNDPNSIMDWFKRHGMDGSYAARERLFHRAGLTGYRGTPEQNTILLRWLKANFGP